MVFAGNYHIHTPQAAYIHHTGEYGFCGYESRQTPSRLYSPRRAGYIHPHGPLIFTTWVNMFFAVILTEPLPEIRHSYGK